MKLLLLLTELSGIGLWGKGFGLMVLADLLITRLGVDWLSWIEDGGVEEPLAESRVDEDLVVGIVPLDVPLDSLEVLVLLEVDFSAFNPVFRRRSSLRKGILGGEIPSEVCSFLGFSRRDKGSHWGSGRSLRVAGSISVQSLRA